MLLDDFIVYHRYSQTYSYLPDYIMQISSYKSYGSNQNLLMPPGTSKSFLNKSQYLWIEHEKERKQSQSFDSLKTLCFGECTASKYSLPVGSEKYKSKTLMNEFKKSILKEDLTESTILLRSDTKLGICKTTTNVEDINTTDSLCQIQDRKSNISSKRTFFLLFRSFVGTGFLFLPGAFVDGGLLFSCVHIIMFGILSYICYILLIQAKVAV